MAPDHPKIKSIANNFDSIARSARVRFFGNVEVGRDISRSDLLDHYDSVLYATGGSVSRKLALPGSDLSNIFGASEFVGWYNGHPDDRQLQVDLSGTTAVVVGVGNVALDVARILTMPIEELERTDIADNALEALRSSQIREVCLVARRGPVQAAFTPKELRQLLGLSNVRIEVDPADLELDAASEAELAKPLNTETRENLSLLREVQTKPQIGDRSIRFIFSHSPTAFAGSANVSTMTAVVNKLATNDSGAISAQATDEWREIPASLVINATGYQGLPVDGLGFDEQRSVIANAEGRVISSEGQPVAREYVAGWIKRGASGVVGSNRQCAVESVKHLVADLGPAPLRADDDILAQLNSRKVKFVSYDDWLLLDQHEIEQGGREGRPRRKETEVSAMLEIIRSRKADASPTTGSPMVSSNEARQGAVVNTSAARTDVKTHFRTCSLCEAMCGIKIEYEGEKILSIAGDPEDPHSQGHICPKGYALQDLHTDPDRLKTPMKRIGHQWIPIPWDEALDEVAERLVGIQAEHGNDAVAAYWGNPTAHNLGIMLTLEKFRATLRSRNLFSASSLDQIPHQLVSYFMYGHSQLFTIPDIDRTDYMLMLGANPAASNGSLMSAGDVLGRLQGITERGGKIVLIDPRRTETAMYTSEHQFIQPGSDALFLLGLIQVILAKGLSKPGRLIDLVKGWDELTVLMDRIPLDRIASETGIPADVIERIATEFAAAERAVCYGRMGVSTQAFGAMNHWLIQLLNILTGNVDREGGMMFTTPAFDLAKMSGRGGFDRYQSRVRGRAEFGREFPTAILAEEMLTPGSGQVRAFVSIAGNPVLSSPNGRQLEEALSGLDYMVAVDFYLNETTRHADIILPPTGPLEHEQYDIVFNLLAVRNVAKYSEALFPHKPGTRSDLDIFTGLIKRMQALKMKRKSLVKRLKHMATEQVTDLLTPQRVLDLALRTGPYGKGLSPLRQLNPFSKGLDLATLKKHPHGLDLGPLQQCLPQRLFTADKRIQLMPPRLVTDLDRLCERYSEKRPNAGLLLIGRRDLRTNNSWMHNSYRLVKGKDRCALFMHPEDARAQQLEDRDQVRVMSSRGELIAIVRTTEDIKPGVVSLPHGWGHHREGIRLRTAQAHPGVSINDITDERVLDELSGNAVLNGVPVQLERLAAV
ncbi:molybdopterin-dependent oxidoreductase [Allohahella marinimesophila]|uniref:molybdopterin-dependent oxidoreductase n=1 Tax=Allohahella marinimesophila TaxID=1054972 RepID=UPI0031D2D499